MTFEEWQKQISKQPVGEKESQIMGDDQGTIDKSAREGLGEWTGDDS